MLEALTSETGLAIALAAVVGLVVLVTAIRIAVKLAVRVALVGGVVLAGLYAAGVIG